MVEYGATASSGKDEDGNKRKIASKARTKKQSKKKKTFHTIIFEKRL